MEVSVRILALGLIACLIPLLSRGDSNNPSCGSPLHLEYDVAPEILWKEPPHYPEKLRHSGNIGDVLLVLSIAPDGTARDFEIGKSDHPSLESAVIDAVLQARFKPALKNGKPLDTKVCIPVKFKMDADGLSYHNGVSPYQFPSEGSKDLPAELQYDEPPKNLIVTAPIYPFDLATQGIEGTAKVSFLIGPSGSVVETHIIEATHPEFGLATAAMLESWQFEPALKKGQKPYSLFIKEMAFSIKDRDSGLSDSARELLTLSKDSRSEIYALMDLDKAPTALYQVMPLYPFKYLQKQAGDSVLIEFFLDTTGTVQMPRIITATNTLLAWDAATALARWRFDPPMRGGKPVRARIQMPFEFK
jgi:TonB family protein